MGHLSSIRLIVEAQHALGIMSKKSVIKKIIIIANVTAIWYLERRVRLIK